MMLCAVRDQYCDGVEFVCLISNKYSTSTVEQVKKWRDDHSGSIPIHFALNMDVPPERRMWYVKDGKVMDSQFIGSDEVYDFLVKNNIR